MNTSWCFLYSDVLVSLAKVYWQKKSFAVVIIALFTILLTFATYQRNTRWLQVPDFAVNRVPRNKPTSTEPAEYHKEKPWFPSFRNATDLSADTNILAARLHNRLGNQMFQLASLYALARDNSMTPMALDYQELLTCFPQINVALSSEGHPEKDWPHQGEGGAMTYSIKLNNMFSKNTSIFLSGYRQSWKYFHHRENEIRSQFIFNKTVQKDVDTFLHAAAQTWRILGAKTIKDNSSVDTLIPSIVPRFIGLHVRRGDFLQKRLSKYGFTVPQQTYYTRAVQHMADLFKKVVFVVVSDDMLWSKANITSDRHIVVYSPFTKANQDMCLLASCNHTIMSTGTYSWWGAWLAGGHTVYPKGYPEPNTWLGKQYTEEDYYLPGWNEL